MTPEIQVLLDTYATATEAHAAAVSAYSAGLSRTRAEMGALQTAMLEVEAVELTARNAYLEAVRVKAEAAS